MTPEEIAIIKKLLKASDEMERYSEDPDMARGRTSREEYFKQRSAIIGIIMKWGALDKDGD